MPGEPRQPGWLALHPIVVAALVVWLVNDHVLKGTVAGPLPGKLSDIASLVAFPVLPYSLTELLLARWGRRVGLGHLVFWAAAAAFVMAAINLWPAAADAYRLGLGALQAPFRALAGGGLELRPVGLTIDATDLWTLPAAAVPCLVAWRSTTRLARPTRAAVAA